MAPEEWHVLLKDRLPAYISWERYENNLRRLEDNRAVADARGATRDGDSLLQGLVVCGCCGARMTVHYHGSDRRYGYVCARQATDYGGSPCQYISGAPLDRFVSGDVLEALKPAALELSLEAAKNVERERAELDGLWRKRLERASYEAQRAGRHYRFLESPKTAWWHASWLGNGSRSSLLSRRSRRTTGALLPRNRGCSPRKSGSPSAAWLKTFRRSGALRAPLTPSERRS